MPLRRLFILAARNGRGVRPSDWLLRAARIGGRRFLRQSALAVNRIAFFWLYFGDAQLFRLRFVCVRFVLCAALFISFLPLFSAYLLNSPSAVHLRVPQSMREAKQTLCAQLQLRVEEQCS